jgi:hypothetical protein
MPYTQDGLDGFANYAKALVQHFGTNLTSIEVYRTHAPHTPHTWYN